MAGERRRNPRGEGVALRAQILEAVEGILNTQTRLQDVNVSLREVARQVGVTAPSIYLHFVDKNALAWGLVTAGFTSLDETIASAAADEDTTPVDRLTAAALAYCLFLENRPGLAGVMFSGDPMRWAPDPGTQHPASLIARRWEALIGDAMADENRSHDDIRAAATSLWSLLHGRTMLSVIYPAGHAPEQLARFVTATVPALLAAPTEQLAAFSAAAT